MILRRNLRRTVHFWKRVILGVIMHSDLKCSSQCIKAVTTANMVLGMTKSILRVRNKKIILQLYRSL